MGRHSAPDDLEEDVDPADAAGGTTVALADGPDGRHTRTDGSRPRPSVDDDPPTEGLTLIDDALEDQTEASDDVPAAPMVVIDAETSQAMVLEPIDEPLAAEPLVAEPPAPAAPAPTEPEEAAHDAPTTEIALADIARLDRPVPEETTVRIAPVRDAPILDDPPATAPSTALPPPTGKPLPGAAPIGAASPSPQPPPIPAPRPAGAHATRHDFALVMRHGDVRARTVAAVLVPFVVYVAVLAVIGKLQVHSLIWIWIPAIVAGVLVGLALDAGHRRYPAPAAAPAPDRPAPAPVSEPAGPA